MRHRHQQPRVRQKLGPRPRHPARDGPREFEPVVIFQTVDDQPRGTVLEARHRTRPRENRGVGDGGRRHEARLTQILLEGRAEPVAIGLLDEAHARPAARAQGLMRGGRLTAADADRRKDEVEKRMAGVAGDRPRGGEAWTGRQGDHPSIGDESAPARNRLAHVPQKLADLCDKDMRQHLEVARFLVDRVD